VFEAFGAQVGFMVSAALVVAGSFAFLEWLVEKDDG
tara:strand:- start:240 stop:347 length:108 start_codon:yes stop_codon:yes gene_type:complete